MWAALVLLLAVHPGEGTAPAAATPVGRPVAVAAAPGGGVVTPGGDEVGRCRLKPLETCVESAWY